MWATLYIEQLQKGHTVQFRPRGGSMTPYIKSGQLVIVRPFADGEHPQKGDIVLCSINARTQYLHFVRAVDSVRGVQIGNAHGRINGWTSRANVYGLYVR